MFNFLELLCIPNAVLYRYKAIKISIKRLGKVFKTFEPPVQYKHLMHLIYDSLIQDSELSRSS